MGHSLVLILGGARSGKSSYAQQLARDADGAVLFVATAEAGDEEMRARIAAHRAERPAAWTTLEASRDVAAAIESQAPHDVVLLDCITLLASNVLTARPEPWQHADAEAAVLQEVNRLLDAYAHSAARWILISNEVGLGLAPPYPLGRVYRDALGRVNQQLAAAADEVVLMIAGLPLRVKGQAT